MLSCFSFFLTNLENEKYLTICLLWVSQSVVVSLGSLNSHIGGDWGMILSGTCEICLYSIMKYCYFCCRWYQNISCPCSDLIMQQWWSVVLWVVPYQRLPSLWLLGPFIVLLIWNAWWYPQVIASTEKGRRVFSKSSVSKHPLEALTHPLVIWALWYYPPGRTPFSSRLCQWSEHRLLTSLMSEVLIPPDFPASWQRWLSSFTVRLWKSTAEGCFGKGAQQELLTACMRTSCSLLGWLKGSER